MAIVPQPERVPLPPGEPVWTVPDIGIYMPGDFNLGDIKPINDVAYRKHTPLKHFHPGPLGFTPNDMTQEVNQDGE